MKVAVINCGSSSIKYEVFGAGPRDARNGAHREDRER